MEKIKARFCAYPAKQTTKVKISSILEVSVVFVDRFFCNEYGCTRYCISHKTGL